MKTKQKIIIAGPCAAESREQVINCALTLKKQGIKIMRASLWKPRTQPGFEGVGTQGIAWLSEVTKLGMTVATEILLPEQLIQLIKGIDKKGDLSKVLLWIGSRNQNHLIQREIAKIIKEKMPKNVKLLIKNQAWTDERHWLGIVDHIVGSGISPRRLILCHRGFAPHGQNNPDNFRNPPDFEMAMRVKEKTGMPMLIDPSHIGGSVENVTRVMKMADIRSFDGMMIEVHPMPIEAKSDAKQQLTFTELDKLLKII
jgi:chorismate mutase